MDINRLDSVIEGIRDVSNKQEDVSDLVNIILNIKQKFEAHWKESYIPLAKKLQSKLSDGIPTPVLTVCGQGTREIRFTKYLAYFLDPSKDHGLGTSFLKSVFSCYVGVLPPDWSDDCVVIPELWIGDYINGTGKNFGCSCDIGILGSNYAIIIEQKILSGEDTGNRAGLRQLQRYSKVLDKNPEYSGKQIIKIYLTPTGKLPIKADGWIAMAYQDIIDRGYNLLSTGALSVAARENLRSLLIDLIIGPYEDTYEIINEMKCLARSLLSGSYNLKDILRFSSIKDANRMFLNIVMEG